MMLLSKHVHIIIQVKLRLMGMSLHWQVLICELKSWKRSNFDLMMALEKKSHGI